MRAFFIFLWGIVCMASTTFEPKNRPYDVDSYRVSMSFDPRPNPDTFSATVRTRLVLGTVSESIDFDIDSLTVRAVTLVKPQRASVEFMSSKDSLRLTLPRGLKAGQTLEFEIAYEGKIASNHNGFFKVADPDDPSRGSLFFTHFEALGARAFLPCNDEPYDKALTSIEVSVPKGYQVLSNGQLKSVKTHRAGAESWQRFQWAMKKPHSTYLMSLAIGKFEKVVDSKKADPEVAVWIGKKRKDRAGYVLEITRKAMSFFESYLGVAYPWEKYDTIGLPTYLWGGMENTSATHMNEERTVLNDPRSSMEKRRIVSLAAHELAHQWFGDLVTMKWWDDLWLNEAFASYFGTLATKHVLGSEEEQIVVVTDTWNEYFREENGPRSHPIVDKTLTSVDDAFDATNYTKGEAVLRMLSDLVGEKSFQKAVGTYLKQHAFRNATYREFFDTVSMVTGKNVTAFRDSWLVQKGYPILSYGGQWESSTKTYTIRLSQRPNHGGKDFRPFVFPLPVAFHRKNEPVFTQRAHFVISKPEETFSVQLPAEPDWVSVNTEAIALVKLEQKKYDEEKLIQQADGDPDSLSRIWAVFELASGLLRGESISSRGEAQVLRSLQRDVSPYVRSAILGFFKRTKSRWLPERLGKGIAELVREYGQSKFEHSSLFQSDPHGWCLVKAELVGALGRVKNDGTLPLVAKVLSNRSLPLDDLSEAAYAAAVQGLPESIPLLKTALDLHGHRGYRYQFWIQYAFGSVENVDGAAAIAELAKVCSVDMMGRIGWAVKDNQTLKNSKEWSDFLADFILNNNRFGDDVKARVLQTLDEVKARSAQVALDLIVKGTKSERIRELATRTLKKNFS